MWLTMPEHFEEFNECFQFNNFKFTPTDCNTNSVRVGRIKNVDVLLEEFLGTMCSLPNVESDGKNKFWIAIQNLFIFSKAMILKDLIFF